VVETSIISNWCDKKLLEVLKTSVQEFGTPRWKSNFKDCNKRDAITNVINSQNLRQNIKRN
jgi:hypothetical protein